MIYAFYFFAGLLVWFSFRSFRGGIDYLEYFRESLAASGSGFNPFATVIVPCRGLDDGLEANLAAVLCQKYERYEVILVVDDEADPAVDVIERSIAESSPAAKLIVAPRAIDSAQKIENLREAVLHSDDRSQIFVFADSDVRPSSTWLRSLVAPLADEKVGATTGYRWFISPRPTFGSEIRSAWNASIASALGPNRGSNFCWGGSTAIRRDVFDAIDMREKWRGTLSDDFAVTHALTTAGYEIVFVPQALNASVENCTFAQMLEFTTRQMKITRVCMPRLWLMSMFGSGLFNGVMLTAFLIVVLSPRNDLAVSVSIVTLALVSFFSIGKAWLRLKAVRLVLPQYDRELRRQAWTQLTLWLLTPAVFLFNCLAALFSRRIRWRGTTYELKSPNETVIISS